MPTIDDKTKIPLGFAAMVLGAALSLGSGLTVEHYRVNQLELFRDAHLADHVQQATRTQTNEMKIQKLELTLDNIATTLLKMDDKLERMEARDARNKGVK